MYSVLIVDDERYMRDGIAKILPWDYLHIDRVETAESGRKALQQMREHMPDIVVTDIEMKNMDGLALIKEMNRINPHLRIIVLTGHDDFAYVQECCRMEVHDYLLKPVDEVQLTQVIRTQTQALEHEVAERSRRRTMELASGLAEQAKVEQAFRQFFRQSGDLEQIREILDDYGYQKGEQFQAAVIVSASMVKNEWSSRQDLLDLSIKSVCIEQIEYHHHGVTFWDEQGLLVLLLFCGPGHPDSLEQTEQLQTILQNEYELTQEIYLGGVVSQIEQIPESYREALHSWKNGAQDGREYEDVIASAKQYINQHLDEPLSVAQLAGKFYVSVAYFSKLFKKAEGVGCNYYIMCQRMERAKHLLKHTPQRVREVSRLVGYRDVNYFSLTFKKYVGLAPAEYRERG